MQLNAQWHVRIQRSAPQLVIGTALVSQHTSQMSDERSTGIIIYIIKQLDEVFVLSFVFLESNGSLALTVVLLFLHITYYFLCH